MKSYLKEKKGVLGLDDVSSVIKALLVLSVLAFAVIIALSTLTTTNLTVESRAVANESSAWINGSGYTLTYTSVTGSSAYSISAARGYILNATLDEVAWVDPIPTGNYSVSSTGVLTNSTSDVFGSVELDYTYNENTYQQISNNVSGGISNFFGNAPTFFAIMAAVVILLMIVLILVAVNRFGSGSQVRV